MCVIDHAAIISEGSLRKCREASGEKSKIVSIGTQSELVYTHVENCYQSWKLGGTLAVEIANFEI